VQRRFTPAVIRVREPSSDANFVTRLRGAKIAGIYHNETTNTISHHILFSPRASYKNIFSSCD
jgi:hypothetical protein